MIVQSYFYNVFIFLNFVSIISTNNNDCSWEKVDSCLKSFKPYLDSGTEMLRNYTEPELAEVCWRYNYASNCVTPFMYLCPEVKSKLHSKFEMFEYACTVDRDEDPLHWPIMPTLDPHDLEVLKQKELDEEYQKFVDNLMKASLAAGITLLMVGACFAASLISKYRIRKKIEKQRKLRAPVEVKVLDDQEKLIKSLIGVDKKKNNNEPTYQSADK